MLVPALGSWVIARVGGDRERHPGQVQKVSRSGDRVFLTVYWLADRKTDVVPLSKVECGLRVGFEVLQVPDNRYEASLGMGRIIAGREIGGRQQRSVDFAEAGRRIWMPWERLRFVKGAMYRFGQEDFGGKTAATQIRFCNPAPTRELWHEHTVSLPTFNILPI